MRPLLGVFALCFVGCIPSNAQIRSVGGSRLARELDQVQRDLEGVKAEWEAETDLEYRRLKGALIFVECRGLGTPQCGLVVDAMSSCRDLGPEECLSLRWDDTLTAIQVRYRVPTEYPRVGEDLASFEFRMLVRYNDGLSAQYERASRELNVRYRARAVELVEAYEKRRAEISEEIEGEVRDAKRARTVLKAFLLAFAAGAKAYGQSVSGSAVRSDGCLSDHQCRYGEACVKPVGELRGACIKTVNTKGNPTWEPPRNNYGLGEAACHSDLGCPYGFQCVRGNCLTR